MIGTKISHYEILRKLGEGGMGEVYLARDTELGRSVAIKRLPERLAANREALERFQREARAAAALQHPNIVTIHEILHHGDVHCIVMAYIEGDLLSESIARGALSAERAIEITLALCDALGQAHAAGIVHRDLKPSNIIVDRRGQPHVLDFGLALDDDSTRLTQAGTTLGTPNYMSPEQARGGDVDARTDVFSLGAILYEMITTKRAFTGDSPVAVCRQIVEVDPQPLSRYSSEASPDLERIVATALAKDREVRYQTMSGLAAALRALETPRRAASRPALKASRRSIGMAAAAAVLLAIAAIAWIGFSGRRSTTRDATPAGLIRALAVLPFEGRTADAEQSYFADGMTDALIHELGRISALNVVGRGSTFEYRASTLPRQQIAAALRADALVEGSVLLAGDRVRINVELALADGDRLWGDTYEGEIGDVFVLQADVAQEIARQVRVNLAPFEKARFRRARAVDPDALRAHLRGQYYANLQTMEGVNEALEHFERAITYDPSCAECYVSLAETYFTRGYYTRASNSDWAKADSFALQALERDQDLEGAHLVLAQIRLLRDWDLAAARRAVERARDINPNAPDVRSVWSTLMLVSGDLEKGVQAHRSAVAAYPLDHGLSCSFTRKLCAGRQYEEAVRHGKETIKDFPTCLFDPLYFGEALLLEGRFEEAIQSLQASLDIEVTARGLARLASAHARAGRPETARAILGRLPSTVDYDPYFAAWVHGELGDLDAAFADLDIALGSRSQNLVWLRVEPGFDVLRSDPRYQDLMARIGLWPS